MVIFASHRGYSFICKHIFIKMNRATCLPAVMIILLWRIEEILVWVEQWQAKDQVFCIKKRMSGNLQLMVKILSEKVDWTSAFSCMVWSWWNTIINCKLNYDISGLGFLLLILIVSSLTFITEDIPKIRS